MREIKFRAWDTLRNLMLNEPVMLYDRTSFYLTMNSVSEDTWEAKRYVSSYELMQYTGLKDKNGVEIYEGDIVRKLSGDYKLGKVVFEFGMFCFESIGCGIYAGSDAFLHIHSLHYKEYNSNNNYEVIGNIYEHPQG